MYRICAAAAPEKRIRIACFRLSLQNIEMVTLPVGTSLSAIHAIIRYRVSEM